MQNQSISGKKEKNNFQSVTPEAIYQEEHTHEILYSRYKLYKQSYRTKRDLHYHNHPECGYCKNGDGLFFVEDRIYPFSAGTVVFFPAGMNHIAQSPAERNSIWEYIWFDNKALDLALPSREIIIADRDCGELFRMMGHEIQKNENGNFELYRHLCAAFFEKLNAFSKDETVCNEKARKSILPAISLIAAKYGEYISVAQLAECCRLSESTLRRNFLAITGQSPKSYVNTIRLIIAEQLLIETSISVLDISERCGFSCLSTFNRCFLKRNGIPPSEYRRNLKIEQKTKI